MQYKYEIVIDDLGIDYQDEGPWRSYMLESYGDTIDEVFDNAQIAEIDQDGGELYDYSIEDAPMNVYNQAKLLLLAYLHQNVWRAM